MDYTEMMFAVEVHRLASALRNSAMGEFAKGTGLEDEAKYAAVAIWKAENPTKLFAAEALKEIQDVAAAIRRNG